MRRLKMIYFVVAAQFAWGNGHASADAFRDDRINRFESRLRESLGRDAKPRYLKMFARLGLERRARRIQQSPWFKQLPFDSFWSGPIDLAFERRAVELADLAFVEVHRGLVNQYGRNQPAEFRKAAANFFDHYADLTALLATYKGGQLQAHGSGFALITFVPTTVITAVGLFATALIFKEQTNEVLPWIVPPTFGVGVFAFGLSASTSPGLSLAREYTPLHDRIVAGHRIEKKFWARIAQRIGDDPELQMVLERAEFSPRQSLTDFYKKSAAAVCKHWLARP